MDQKTSTADVLLSTLTSDAHVFLQPSQFTSDSVLSLVKHYLDPLALGITEEQLHRQKDARRKRKRGHRDTEDQRILGLRKVHVTGFEVDQVWEQARRILDAARTEVENGMPTLEAVNGIDSDSEENDEEEDLEQERLNRARKVRFAEASDDKIAELDGTDEEEDYEDDSDVEEDMDGTNGVSDQQSEVEDEEDIEMDDDDLEEEDDAPAETYNADPFGLNDGFFSIDDFNRRSEFLENQDARGGDDGAASDEDEVDWHANPLDGGAARLPSTSKAHNQEGDDDEDDDEEEGPALGNMDLDAPEGASDEDDDEDEDINAEDAFGFTNANNVMYSDFFAPPAQKAGKSTKKKGRPHPHNFPEATSEKLAAPEDDMAEIERRMAAVHRELFSDSDDEGSGDSLSDRDPGDPKARRSTHERRQAKLAEEIRKLEAENVAKRSWTLSGEARAADRPLNSLLEEDLEFERAGKPVPVITQEVSEDIEALIKRRVLAEEFDELIRRRPDDLATGDGWARRGLINLSDTKSSKGLAELYEEDHLRTTDPNYVSEKDSKLAAAHAEISMLWKDVSAKLDALSSWNYRPKPAMPALEVRVEAPAITMEDARPTVGGEVEASMLAPQEVYKPGMDEEKGSGEVYTKGGLPVNRNEMSREEKAARRGREKDRQRKANLNAPTRAVNGTNGVVTTGTSKKSKDEKEVLGALKKGGVQVIGKKGELTAVDGRTAKASATGERAGVGAYKL